MIDQNYKRIVAVRLRRGRLDLLFLLFSLVRSRLEHRDFPSSLEELVDNDRAHDHQAPGIVAQIEHSLMYKRYYGDAFPRWWVNFGPGIMAGYLGACVNSVPDTVWFEPAECLEARNIEFCYQPDNRWWLRTKAMTQAAVDAWDGQIQVGHTDLGGNLDILASFRTAEGLLYDLIDAPQEVERLVGEITRLWLRYYDELDALIRPACRGTTSWAPIAALPPRARRLSTRSSSARATRRPSIICKGVLPA